MTNTVNGEKILLTLVMHIPQPNISSNNDSDYDNDYVNFIVSVLNWAIEIKSKETDYTVNYQIDCPKE